jgi:dihydroorotase-like cyclic amidohydrolase
MLWQHVENGCVDFVATDHAPYEIATEKQGEGLDIWTSLPGIPGVETIVPVIVSEGYNKGRISLARLVEILSTNPAKHYGLYPKKGSLQIGADADLTIIDLEKEWEIRAANMHNKAKYTSFEGIQLKGKPVKTIVRGHVVYDDGIVGKPGYGMFIKRQTISKLDRLLKY